MKKGYLLIFCFIAALPLFAQTVQTTTSLNLRVKPNTTAAVKTVLPKGVELEIEICDDQWCRVTYQNIGGYVSKKYLKQGDSVLILDTDPELKSKPLTLDPNPPTTPVRYYINTNGEQVQSPTGYKSPPQDATAVCRDGTYSRSQSRKGTCSHHGGVAQWLN